jgi:RNA polymerase sigma-54 factor
MYAILDLEDFMQEMGFVQTQSMKQQMKFSPQMIMSATLMSLPVDNLSERIYKEAEKNPAIEITKYATVEPVSVRMSQHYGSTSRSDEYQSFLENVPAPQETLQAHLQAQLDLLSLTEDQYRVGYRIIHNLDGHGYNLEDPETLLNTSDTFQLMEKMLDLVQHFDPPGTACKNLQQSLLVQSKIKADQQCKKYGTSRVPSLVFTILKDYFEVLKKRPSTMYKTLLNEGIKCTYEDVEQVLSFIRTLAPYPAAAYSSVGDAENRYISPEAIIKRLLPEEREMNELNAKFAIDFLRGNIPEIEVSSVFKELSLEPRAKTETEKQTKQFVSDSINKAMVFIEALERRTQALQKIITVLVQEQSEYFDKGPGHLQPLRMIDIAIKCGVDESTVSRIANGKYVLCDWGLIEIKSLFTGAVSRTRCIKNNKDSDAFCSVISDSSKPSEEATVPLSRDSVIFKIQNIIEEYEKNGNKKKLSDQKISDILAQKGIKVARRTVSKYRSKLSIRSSYDR